MRRDDCDTGTQRFGDLWAAIKSDQPTIKKYRSIRKDREILEALINR